MDSQLKEELREAVYTIVRMIPRGRATSYGAIARAAGFPSHSRLVGNLMSQCSGEAGGIPAHRVVNSQGILSGREAFGEPGMMKRLLEAEGVSVSGNRIRGWKKVFWDPGEEIGITG